MDNVFLEDELMYPSDQPTPSTSGVYAQPHNTDEEDEAYLEALEGNVRAELSALEALSPIHNSDESDDGWPECDSMVVLLALNEAYVELVSQMITKVERAIEINLQRQRDVISKQRSLRESELISKKKVPVLQYLPPYFKDDNMMCPPLSCEAKEKLKNVAFDPLTKEEKKWNNAELKLLRSAVKESMLANKIQPLKDRLDIVQQKVKDCGIDTTDLEKSLWEEEIHVLQRKIEYERSLPDDDVLIGDYSNVDWVKIANKDFKGARTPSSVRLKWTNEQCPTYNTGSWTKDELERLKQLREKNFVSWGVVADMLGTKRSPWMCFEKYKSDIYIPSREWTHEEDEKLIALVNLMRVNGKIQWDKVTYNMRGRHRQQVRTRYMRTLDKNVKHGRWTEPEDLLLMCAVSRLGAKDWVRIAKSVPGRTDVQCRDRWITGLDKRNACKEWSLEDDEKLLFAVAVFGRGQWVKCSQVLGNRLPDQCRYRFQTLLSTKIRLLSCQVDEASSERVKQASKMGTSRMISRNIELNRKYRRFNEMINGDDETGDKLLDSIIEKTNSKGGKPRIDKKFDADLSEADRQRLREGLEKISKKYTNGDVPDITQIIESIPLTDEDVFSMMKQSKLSSHFQRSQAVFVKSRAKMRRIRKTQYLLADNVPIETTFDDSVSEDERVIRLSEALCQAVRKYDQHQWGIEFNKEYAETAKFLSNAFVEKMIDDSCSKAGEAYRTGGPLPLDTTLPPTSASFTILQNFEILRPILTRCASHYFKPSYVGINHELFNKRWPAIEKYNMSDRLYIPLSNEIKQSSEYLKVKSFLRSILLEPLQFKISCEGQIAEARREETALQLIERETEESNILQGVISLESVNDGEVENVVTEQIDLENLNIQLSSCPDELNRSIEDVIDNSLAVSQIKEEPREKKKRRSSDGPPAKKSRLQPQRAPSRRSSSRRK